MKKTVLSLLMLLCMATVVLSLTACGVGEEDSSPSSGDSGTGAPISFLGKTYVGNVTKNDGGPNVLSVGDVFTYTFIDQSTIYGTGFVPVVTTSWDYTASGNTATVRLFFSAGKVVQKLTFLTPTSGIYHSDAALNSGTTGWHEGTFTISDYTGGTTTGGTTTGGTTTGGTTTGGNTTGGNTTGGNTTGQIAVWTSRSTSETGSISVKIDNAFAGSLTTYYTSTPTCGDSGTITKTLAVGTHSLSAADGPLTWGPGNFTITAGGCLVYELD